MELSYYQKMLARTHNPLNRHYLENAYNGLIKFSITYITIYKLPIYQKLLPEPDRMARSPLFRNERITFAGIDYIKKGCKGGNDIMRMDFDYFAKAIPSDLYARTKATISQYIAIFEPEEFALGKVISVDDYHFVLFHSNAPVTRVRDVEYKVRKGDLLVIQPWDEVYGVPGSNKAHGKYLHIAVKKEFFSGIASEIARGEQFAFKRIHGRYSDQLLDLIGLFQLEIMNYGQSYPLMLRSLSTQIVFQLIRDLECSQDIVGEMVENNPYISKAIMFMQEHYQSNISINDICNLIYLSPGHFKRVFKEKTGRTPHQYLMDIRIEKSKELLERKEGSIEDVAKRCGFINAGHFAVAFKRNTKLSPSEYRKKHQAR